MIRRNRETGDAVRMALEMRDKRGLNPSSAAVSRDKALPRRTAPTDSSIVDFRAEVILQFAIVIQVEIFEKIADAWLVTICSPLSSEYLGKKTIAFGVPCVTMAGSDDTRGLWKFLTVETGVVLPEISGESSARMRGASRTPTALVLEDPTAGAAFCPSVLPTCRRSGMRSAKEFVVETMESVGLLGRSWPAGGFGGARDVG